MEHGDHYFIVQQNSVVFRYNQFQHLFLLSALTQPRRGAYRAAYQWPDNGTGGSAGAPQSEWVAYISGSGRKSAPVYVYP
jgi:hypothetical protein